MWVHPLEDEDCLKKKRNFEAGEIIEVNDN
jgi:hypothetical protein